MDVAGQAALGEHRFTSLAAVSAIGPDPAGSVCTIKHIIQLLTVMHRGAADGVAPHQLVAAINVDVVLVSKMRLAMLPGPARILVLLAVLGGVRLPSRRGPARFDLRIIVT